MEILTSIIIVITGYIIGTFNPSYILGKINGMDIRQSGSGNAGASNALINFGKMWGVICAFIDIAKPCVTILICKKIFPKIAFITALAGGACILGHMYPFYMGFRGGKGLACLGGTVLAYDWKVFIIFLAGALILAIVSDYICFVPMSASVIFAITYGFMEKDIIGTVVLLLISVCIILRHKENIQRIKEGTELRISYLWKKDSEMERVIGNSEK